MLEPKIDITCLQEDEKMVRRLIKECENEYVKKLDENNVKRGRVPERI